jgi:glycosyltransferase involved in cell wall biosynthesis
MKKIKFSIIVAVYNTVYIDGENMLIKCLDSLIHQSYENIEIVLVDDGSTDEAAGLCDKYADMDSRVVVIHKDNEGAGEARNTGIRKATGDYVFFVDADDTIEEKSCDVFAGIIQRCPDVDIIASDYRLISGKKATCRLFSKSIDCSIMSGQDFMVYQFERYSMHTVTGHHIIKRSYILDYDIFFDKDLTIAEDLEWGPRLYIPASSVITSGFMHYNHYHGHISRGAPVDPAEKYIPFIHRIYELERQYSSIPHERLQKLLKDYLVQLYFFSFRIGKYYRKKYRHLIDRDFVKRNAHLTKVTTMSSVFLVSPWLYCALMKIHTKLKMLLK